MKKYGMLIAALLLAGCTPVLIGGAGAGGYYVGKDERPAKVIASDAAITAQVNAQLVTHSDVSALDIDVDTYDGVVSLHGTAKSLEAAQKAISLAKAIKGVKRVESHLKVVP